MVTQGINPGLKLANSVGVQLKPSSGLLFVQSHASSRKDVVFCKVVSGKPDPQLAIDGEVHVVQIDFTDFRHVSGDKQALAAFDVGWAVLHEIDHVVADSEDRRQDGMAGDCESLHK